MNVCMCERKTEGERERLCVCERETRVSMDIYRYIVCMYVGFEFTHIDINASGN